MVLGGFIIEACQDSGQESPEGDGLVVGDVKSLQREPETRNRSPRLELSCSLLAQPRPLF